MTCELFSMSLSELFAKSSVVLFLHVYLQFCFSTKPQALWCMPNIYTIWFSCSGTTAQFRPWLSQLQSSSHTLILGTYLRNAGRVGYVYAWPVYMTQQIPPVQKHLSLTLEWLCRLLMFYRPMYLGLALLTDISCHKAATVFIPCPSLSFPLSPLPHPASFKIQELDRTLLHGFLSWHFGLLALNSQDLHIFTPKNSLFFVRLPPDALKSAHAPTRAPLYVWQLTQNLYSCNGPTSSYAASIGISYNCKNWLRWWHKWMTRQTRHCTETSSSHSGKY
jgi:hypothetical protein